MSMANQGLLHTLWFYRHNRGEKKKKKSVIKYQLLKRANQDSVKEMGSLWNGRSQIILEFVFCSFPWELIMNALDIEEKL